MSIRRKLDSVVRDEQGLPVRMSAERFESSILSASTRYSYGGRAAQIRSMFKDLYDVETVQVPVPKKRRAPRKKKVRTPEQTLQAFTEIMVQTGRKKQLGVADQAIHEVELGFLEAYQEERRKAVEAAPPDSPPPKRLCGICHDPFCPWSD